VSKKTLGRHSHSILAFGPQMLVPTPDCIHQYVQSSLGSLDGSEDVPHLNVIRVITLYRECLATDLVNPFSSLIQ